MKAFIYNLPLILVLLVGGFSVLYIHNLGTNFTIAYGAVIALMTIISLELGRQELKRVPYWIVLFAAVATGIIVIISGVVSFVLLTFVNQKFELGLEYTSIAILSSSVIFTANSLCCYQVAKSDSKKEKKSAKENAEALDRSLEGDIR